MITPEVVRELAMSLSGTEERDHCGIPSFRVRKIYATLWPDDNWVHLMLSPEMQHELIAESPGIFQQLPNKWGLNGATRVFLDQ
ncbi:MmcQ/YjbR family DNA-binding protein, partial [bacterium]